MPVAARSGGRAERSGRRCALTLAAPAAPVALVGPATLVGPPRRLVRSDSEARRRRSSSTSRVDLGDVEVDGLRVGAGVARREVGRDLLGDPAVAAATSAEWWVGRRHRQSSAEPGRIRRQPVRVRRMPSASGGPVDLARRREPARVGRAQLEHVEAVGRLARALARPGLDGVGGRVEQLVEALRLVGRERRQDVVDGAAVGIADADPEPAELLGAELVDDRAQAVVAAVAAALAEAELAERQREVVGDDEQVGQRRVLAGEHLADGEAGVVHVGQRLDEGQVEPVGSGP